MVDVVAGGGFQAITRVRSATRVLRIGPTRPGFSSGVAERDEPLHPEKPTALCARTWKV